MKKSVIHIVLDAYCYENLNRKIGDREVTPFLNKLAREAISFENMYALAPYTEASQVSLHGDGENTLEMGGYLFGNATLPKTNFEIYQENGFHTIFSYSPYVFSKPYLKGVDSYYYTRFYSIEPLIVYRLQYFADLAKDGNMSEIDYRCCSLLLDEAFDCWLLQCTQLIEGHKSVKALAAWVADMRDVISIRELLQEEYIKFQNDNTGYVSDLLKQGKNHILRKLNRKYVTRKPVDNVSYLQAKYQSDLLKAQEKYSKIAKRQWVDLDYALGMTVRNKKGKDDAIETLRAYKHYYENKDLENYFSNINCDYKTEISLNCLFDTFFEEIKEWDQKEELSYSFIHVQDFHLPSVFHSLDGANEETVSREIEEALHLFSEINSNYRGNVVADLSAYYCDCKVKEFYAKLKQELKHEFVFVVTADHGFPLYNYPPRPIVYNQTYEEAFHIPFIICDNEEKVTYKGKYTYNDGKMFERRAAGIQTEIPKAKEYFVEEYGGPGCPDIGRKPIWYTFIGNKYRVSFECVLNEDISVDKITSVHDLIKDPIQKRDLFYKKKKIKELDAIVDIVQARHEFLRKNYAGDKFLLSQLEMIEKGYGK